MTVTASVSLADEQHAFAKTPVDMGRHSSVNAVHQRGGDLLRRAWNWNFWSPGPLTRPCLVAGSVSLRKASPALGRPAPPPPRSAPSLRSPTGSVVGILPALQPLGFVQPPVVVALPVVVGWCARRSATGSGGTTRTPSMRYSRTTVSTASAGLRPRGRLNSMCPATSLRSCSKKQPRQYPRRTWPLLP